LIRRISHTLSLAGKFSTVFFESRYRFNGEPHARAVTPGFELIETIICGGRV